MNTIDMWLPSSSGHAEHGLVTGFLFLVQGLVAPLVIIASLSIILAFYGVPIREPYQHLIAVVFPLAFLVFRDTATIRQQLTGAAALARAGDIVYAWLLVIGLLLFIGYATKSSADYSRVVLFTWFIVTPLPILLAQIAFQQLQFAAMRRALSPRQVVIVGVNDLSCRLAEQFIEDPCLHAHFCGFFEDRGTERIGPVDCGNVLGRLDTLPQYVATHRIDTIYIALPIRHRARTSKLLDCLHDTTASIYFVPDIFVFDLIQARMDDINGIPVMALCETPFVGLSGFIKRISDVVIASVVLLVSLPVFLAIGIAIKSTSEGPVFFRQRRYGLDGQEFVVYKFRTMCVTEDGDEVKQASRNDPRITPFGAFLRRWSLDELPQFLNVLNGSMSIVGPRPHAVAHNEMYRKLIKGYMVRHKATPGITGLAQVNGFRGETETVEAMRARVDLDLNYLRNWSLGLDFRIMLKTIAVVLGGTRAY
jgi:putative colanic acid biosynthesis UDP-glucose lipid carrier transferase